MPDFLISTTESVSGYRVTEVLGTVFGVSVRSRSIVGNFLGNLRAAIGGSQEGYVKMVTQSREEAINKMAEQAKNIGANAIIMMRFDSGEFDAGQGQAMNEVIAYGTAVKMEHI